jgi:hypothetical protein
MTNRRIVPATLLFATIAIAACGGNPDSSQFANGPGDAGPAVQTDSGTTLGTGGDGSDGPCSPAALPASFTPTWKGPASSAAGACSDSQIQGFYDACLASGVTPATCSTFTSSNATCAACLQSDDTDSKYGPVIWHASRAYFTINVAGCVADEQNDLSASGCGAAYQAAIQCEETACTQCYDPSTGDFARYAKCESQATTECTKYQSAIETACGGALKDAGSPASACVPHSGATGEDAYLLVAPVFCGENG